MLIRFNNNFLLLSRVLDEVMPVLSEDMFGQPAEEKEVPEFAKKAKETKKSKSYECLEILSGTITMPDCAQRILRPIHEQLPNANRWVRVRIVMLSPFSFSCG